MLPALLLLGTGISLFLFGMINLSNKVKFIFTARIREYIKYAVQRPSYGLLTGVSSTILFQSSSAVTVLTIGMVSAGLITFYHSLSIILGADIGTTLTVQLVVWKVTDISPLFIIIGGTLWMTGRKNLADYGEIFFFFGLLFFGLNLASQATGPLRNNPEIINLFKEAKNPLLSFLIGIVFTGLIHASAITVSIVAILARQGLISIDAAVPAVIGANIGTTVTALMAGMTSSGINGKRSAFAHFLFKAMGSIGAMIALPLFTSFLEAIVTDPAQQVALAHFFFNLATVVFFFPLLKPVSSLIEKMLPGREETLPLWPVYLEESCLSDAARALNCVLKELGRVMTLLIRIYAEFVAMLTHYHEGKRRNITYVVWVVRHIGKEIVSYLRKISTYQLSPELSSHLFAYTGLIDDLVRMSDQMVIVADLLKDKFQKKVDFSPAAKRELTEIVELVGKNLNQAASLFEKGGSIDDNLISYLEREIDLKVKEARERHLVRYCEKVCHAEAGPIFVEILIHLERISDHCENIAEYFRDIEKQP